MRKPKSLKRQLQIQEAKTAQTVRAAIEAASSAIDDLTQRNTALERIIIGERAEALYYIEKYLALSPQPIPFRDLTEDQQTAFHVKAIKDLGIIRVR